MHRRNSFHRTLFYHITLISLSFTLFLSLSLFTEGIATALKPTFPNLVTTEMLFDKDFIPTGGSVGNNEDGGSGGGNDCCGDGGGGNGCCSRDKGGNACGVDINDDVSGGNASCGGGSDSNGEKLCCKKDTETESKCHTGNKSDNEATDGENEGKCECAIQNNSVSIPPSCEKDSEVINEEESDYLIPGHTQDSEINNVGQDGGESECHIPRNIQDKQIKNVGENEDKTEGESKCHIPTHTQGSTTITFVGRRVTIPDGAEFTDYRCVYVGPPGPSLTSLLVRFPQSVFYQVCVFSVFCICLSTDIHLVYFHLDY